MDEPLTNTLNPTAERVVESSISTFGNGSGGEKFATDDEIRGARLHELIDRKFLKILTEAEAQELTELRAWRSKLKSEFYKNIPLAQEEGP